MGKSAGPFVGGNKKTTMENTSEKVREERSETRLILDEFCSVEFSVSSQYPVFQFRVRDISPSGLGILVNEGSKALQHLEKGQLLEMKYNPANPERECRLMETEIRHITHLNDGRYKGQYLVGLKIRQANMIMDPNNDI